MVSVLAIFAELSYVQIGGGGYDGGLAISPGSRSFVVQKRLRFGCSNTFIFLSLGMKGNVVCLNDIPFFCLPEQCEHVQCLSSLLCLSALADNT